jgi:uncharacterized protein (DUF58 family)
MPTIRGWAALGASLALVLLWVGFGEELLLGVAIFLLLAVGFGAVYVRRGVPRVAARRAMTPVQVHDGDRAVVELEISTSKRVAQIVVEDTVHGLGSARFVADRVRSRTPVVARYEVLSRPRGVYRVGPALVLVRDPLAMAEAGGTTGRVDRLVVYPAVEDLSGMPIVRGQDPTVHTARSSFSPTGGDDFYTLREYQQGDDLRRVHWPSSAKRDDLMIRQLETPWQSKALVLLDPRAGSYADAESFEHAVRGAASAVRHLYSSGFSPTLWTGDGQGTTVTSPETYAIAMETLAVVATREMVSLPALVDRLIRGGVAGGALVMVTGRPDEEDVAVHGMLGKDYVRTIVMSVAHDENHAILGMRRIGAIAVVAGPGAAWGPAWREAMENAWSTATAG